MTMLYQRQKIQTGQTNGIILDETKQRPAVILKNKVVAPMDLWKKSPFEEADSRLPYNVWKALQAGLKIFLILSNDTDIIVALLSHMTAFS